MIIFKVIKTPCHPCSWFGGPTHNGRIVSNATCYYFLTEEEAQANCDRHNAKSHS